MTKKSNNLKMALVIDPDRQKERKDGKKRQQQRDRKARHANYLDMYYKNQF